MSSGLFAPSGNGPRDIEPGRSGSPAAISVLMALNARPDGRSLADLAQITGLSLDDVRRAVLGLNERGRIRAVGRGTAAVWVPVRHLKGARR